ncbi:unnamed protein product [Rhizoctonia solani]|uniref:Uncharacterized protein n=1 Tax=Rhizoctonia solani TaxID=456999 RepID=A0A8H3E307_9AGAM|nr:unnamed protein product [Rhizoctonia solani]
MRRFYKATEGALVIRAAMSVTSTHSSYLFNVKAISPLFHLSPIASSDDGLGWAPSCTTQNCLRTASWSTSAINSTLSFEYWGTGQDVVLDGSVEGNMDIQFLYNGIWTPWNPSGDTLFRFQGSLIDNSDSYNVTLKVLDASPDARLTITGARVNATLLRVLANLRPYNSVPADHWIVPSNADGLKYTGFVQEATALQADIPPVYVSSTAGSSMSTRFNGLTRSLNKFSHTNFDAYACSLELSHVRTMWS